MYWFYFILFDLFFFFLQWNHVIFFMYEELSECIFTYNKFVVRFFSQFCSHFDVKLDLVYIKPTN